MTRQGSKEEGVKVQADKVDAFCERLVEAIQLAGGSTSMAEKAGVSTSALSKWRRGESEPTLTHLVEIARAAGVSVAWLANGEGGASRSAEVHSINLEALEQAMMLVYQAEQEKGARLSAIAAARVVRMLYDWLTNNQIPLTQQIVNDVVEIQLDSPINKR